MLLASLTLWFAIVIFPDGDVKTRTDKDKVQPFSTKQECLDVQKGDRKVAKRDHPEMTEGKDYVFTCVQDEKMEKEVINHSV
jgi:hypothetical protein